MSLTNDTITFAPLPNNPQFRNITGERFGRLLTLGHAGQRKNKRLRGWCEECAVMSPVNSHCPHQASKSVTSKDVGPAPEATA